MALYEFHPGQDIFETKADILVNPVNRVGTMGGGLALAFKQRYPAMFQSYHDHCLRFMDLHEGWLSHSYFDDSGVIIWNLPTKDHWRENSDIGLIFAAMLELVQTVNTLAPIRATKDKTTIVAIPKLGSGLGRLDWKDVRPVITSTIDNYAKEIEGVKYLILGEDE